MALVHIEDKDAAPEPLAKNLVIPATDGSSDFNISVASMKENLGQGLLINPDVVGSDEFDIGSTIESDWVEITPDSGTIVWTQKNNHLSAKISSVPNSQAGALLIPIDSVVLGGNVWDSSGQNLFETTIDASTYGGASRICFGLSDGALESSNWLGMHFSISELKLLTTWGIVEHTYSTSYVDVLSSEQFTKRMFWRITSDDGDVVDFQFSQDGVSWFSFSTFNGSASKSLVGLGWTPTHIGFSFLNEAYGIVTSEYVRRLV